MPDLFNVIEAERAKELAMARAADGAGEEWAARAEAAVLNVARRCESFTSDLVWMELGEMTPREPRAIGPVLMRAAKAGIIEATNTHEPSASVRCHRRLKKVWKSLVYGR